MKRLFLDQPLAQLPCTEDCRHSPPGVDLRVHFYIYIRSAPGTEYFYQQTYHTVKLYIYYKFLKNYWIYVQFHIFITSNMIIMDLKQTSYFYLSNSVCYVYRLEHSRNFPQENELLDICIHVYLYIYVTVYIYMVYVIV